ncbi:hypothetical protein IAR50_004019 [Cryptococcus sp. DSM 104548]
MSEINRPLPLTTLEPLNWDIQHAILGHLLSTHTPSVLAKLVLLSREYHKLLLPRLYYQVNLDKYNGEAFFEGLLDAPGTLSVRGNEAWGDERENWYDGDLKESIISRRLSMMAMVRRVVISDFDAAKLCGEASRDLSSLDLPLPPYGWWYKSYGVEHDISARERVFRGALGMRDEESAVVWKSSALAGFSMDAVGLFKSGSSLANARCPMCWQLPLSLYNGKPPDQRLLLYGAARIMKSHASPMGVFHNVRVESLSSMFLWPWCPMVIEVYLQPPIVKGRGHACTDVLRLLMVTP